MELGLRISAAEVRKRLAQYYQEPGREGELRIDMPLGSYLPEFGLPEEPQPAPVLLPEPITVLPTPPPPRPDRRPLLVLGLVAAVAALSMGLWLYRTYAISPLDRSCTAVSTMKPLMKPLHKLIEPNQDSAEYICRILHKFHAAFFPFH